MQRLAAYDHPELCQYGLAQRFAHFTMGFDFNQSMNNATWPRGLHMTFGTVFNRSMKAFSVIQRNTVALEGRLGVSQCKVHPLEALSGRIAKVENHSSFCFDIQKMAA